MKVSYRVIFILIFLFGNKIVAQDAQFSQFFAAPLIINPALTGNTIQDRFSLNYRNQWPAISKGKTFATYAFSYEHNFDVYNSSVGALVYQDKAGLTGLTTTNALLSYAYKIKVTRRFYFKPALQLGLVNRNIDFGELVFNDQLQTGASTSSAALNYTGRSKFSMDINTGIIGYSENYWIGLSIHHLNRPDISLVGNGAMLEQKFSVQGGLTIPLEKTTNNLIVSKVMIAANYKRQEAREQLDIGAYYNHSPFIIGVWYRGIPFKKVEPIFVNSDALILVLGYKMNKISIGYSYDVTISELSSASSGGAHEISTSIELVSRKNTNKRKRRFTSIPCPTF
ncbi:type IX secretion system membrane protein PorP/SprF [Vicingaceae bacterium]|nr:type IX secretion system membrane protein PorP/SprF [Vicingaceae bacterium]MDC1451534.1 type IX secretion system membrane protein PorP/SprF [Vicingaceae bacterium]